MQTLKLSEAIRLGALLSPQGHDGRMDAETRCALSAAADAVGIPAEPHCVTGTLFSPFSALGERWRFLHDYTTHPVSGKPNTVRWVIWNLNDHDRWTREAIADWVATIEPKEQSSDVEAQHEPAHAGVTPVRA